MSQIQNTPRREQLPGKPSQVLSVTQVTWYGVRFTDSQGNVDVALAAEFGTNAEDGEPNIAIVQPENLKAMFTVPHKHILSGVRARIRELKKMTPDIPDGGADLGTIELGEIS